MEQPNLGKRISKLRKAKGLTQRELAEQCKLSVRTIQRIENSIVTPRAYTVKVIFAALGYDFPKKDYHSMKIHFEHVCNNLKNLFNLKINTIVMFYHLKIFLRNMRRNYTYSGINITGLAIGITASVLIFMWVHHERNYNRFYPDADRIYRVFNSIKFGDNDPYIFPSTYPLAMAISNNIPEVESAAMMSSSMFNRFRVGDEIFSGLSGVYVNKTWLDMFYYKPVDGSFDAFGNHPHSIVLTETEAAKCFGESRAVGQVITMNDADYTVQAVVKDNPSNSSFKYNVMASINSVLNENAGQDWNGFNFFIFVKIHRNADAVQVCENINDTSEISLKSPWPFHRCGSGSPFVSYISAACWPL